MSRQPSIDEAVSRSLEKYFKDLEGTAPVSIYDMVIRAVERPICQITSCGSSKPATVKVHWKDMLSAKALIKSCTMRKYPE